MKKSDLYKNNPELKIIIEDCGWRPTVLVADDDYAIVDIFNIAFEMCNIYDVITAYDGNELLKILKAKPVIDLVIIDDNMPTMGGFEFTQRMKRIPVYADVPVIMCSGFYIEETLRTFIYHSKGNILVGKPIDVFHFVTLMNVCLVNHFKLLRCTINDADIYNELLKERREWIRKSCLNLKNRRSFWEGFF